MDIEKIIVDYISENIKRRSRTESVLRNSTGDELGYVDYVWEIDSNVFVFLEYERNQHHPCTNVLKLWPYLDTHAEVKVLLLQIFENKLNSRAKLGFFLANKMKKCLLTNFEYIPYLLSEYPIDELKKEVLLSIEQFSSKNGTK